MIKPHCEQKGNVFKLGVVIVAYDNGNNVKRAGRDVNSTFWEVYGGLGGLY